jgi:hypothetical protein
MRWAGHVACIWVKWNAYSVLAGKRPIGRPRHRRKDNINMDL